MTRPRKELRRLLVRYFNEKELIRLLCRDADLDPNRVEWNGGNADVLWDRVLEEADRAGRVKALLEEAVASYPKATDLRASLDAFAAADDPPQTTVSAPGSTAAAPIGTADPSLSPPLAAPSEQAVIPLPPLGGTMDPESVFYVVRSADPLALAELRQPGGRTMAIKGPRQVGKSSLLARLIGHARTLDRRVVYLDFQSVGAADLRDPDRFFRQFAAAIGDALELEDRTGDDRLWPAGLPTPMRCTRYLERWVLAGISGNLVFALDEADRLFESTFRSDFFGMLRFWHNDRAMKPIWRRVDLVLVTSTEPQLFIEHPNQSPFNVGLTLCLEDFTRAQLDPLNRLHGAPLDAAQLDRLWTLTHGHPYLVRRGLYVVALGQYSGDTLLEAAAHDAGPFADHLLHCLELLAPHPELCQAMRAVIRTGSCQTALLRARLEAAGLVRPEGRFTVPRCPLYAEYLAERLGGDG